MAGLTYRDSGVDADAADALVERIKERARRTFVPGVLAGVGGFASLFSLKDALEGLGPLSDPVLVSGTDGVGTKLKVAFEAGRHDSVGIDLVAMCVNDVVTTGAVPLFFLDYFGTGKLDPEVADQVLAGIEEGCRRGKMALVGGETAELPGLYQEGEYDLAGFALGVVERAQIIDGGRARPGDRLIGVRSTGLHSNGFSLARRALLEHRGYRLDSRPTGLEVELGEELLKTTEIYVTAVQALLTEVDVKALAHITGGGIPGNLPRVLPRGIRARLDRSTWKPQPIFSLIAEAGGVDEAEMFRTFNMGIGLIAVLSEDDLSRGLSVLAGLGMSAHTIGFLEVAPDLEEAEVRLD